MPIIFKQFIYTYTDYKPNYIKNWNKYNGKCTIKINL